MLFQYNHVLKSCWQSILSNKSVAIFFVYVAGDRKLARDGAFDNTEH